MNEHSFFKDIHTLDYKCIDCHESMTYEQMRDINPKLAKQSVINNLDLSQTYIFSVSPLCRGRRSIQQRLTNLISELRRY